MSQILDQHFEALVPLDRLTPHPANARKGDVEAIARSIIANGFYGAVVAQVSSGHILVGNHRYEAARSEGLKELPVFWLDCTDTQALRIMAADNRTADLGGYDEKALAELLTRVQADAGTLEGTGYDQAAFDEIVQQAGDVLLRDAAETPDDTQLHGNRDKKTQIKPVLYIDQIELFEKALSATKLENRGEALMELCRAYVAHPKG